MLKNTLKITLRTLRHNKIYSLINILGLAIGFACFILITTFIRNELSYDTFHENAERIYRPVEIQRHQGVGTQDVAVTMGPLAPALKQDFPQIIEAGRIDPAGTIFCRLGEKGFYESGLAYADPGFLRIFTIPFVDGDPATALNAPNSLVISRAVAEKYFGTQDPMGQALTVHHSRGVDDYVVTGVMENYPKNSHLRFDMLASYITLEPHIPWLSSWGTNTLATYVLLEDGADAKAVEAAFPAFLDKHVGEASQRSFDLYLQPLRDIHLHSRHIVYQTYNHNQGSINTIYLFSAIAVFVLLIACINFMNLSTARSAKRAKEVGIRKVVGSNRSKLIYQFLGESITMALLAVIAAFGLVQLTLPFFESLFDGRILVRTFESPVFIVQMLGVAWVVGVLAGSYPALFLSSYKPIQTLKGAFASTTRGAALRKGLVLVQFIIAITLIACTGLVQDQMEFIRDKELGLNKDQIVYVPLRAKEIRDKVPLLKSELKRHPSILNVSATAGLRGASGSQGTMTVAGMDSETEIMMRRSYVDFDFIETMEMKLVAGRGFSPQFASDTVNSVIINETAAREIGWQEPLGGEFEAGEGNPNYSVIGVVKDFHFYTLHQKIEPLIMFVAPDYVRYLLVKVRPENIRSTLADIEQAWQTLLPGRPFDYGFLDQHFEDIYRSDQKTAALFAAFAGIAIFIACLGLFGLASFTAEQKTKEIGIRKVLGASVAGLVFLLSREFTKWVALACLIAFPLAYFVIQDWLSNFAYRTEIEALTFLLAGGLAVAIALVTVSFQAVKAALVNPVEALRYE